MKLAWPRGRLNGRRITGFDVKLRFNVTFWEWLPRAEWGYGRPMVRWLCFALVAELEYHYLD